MPTDIPVWAAVLAALIASCLPILLKYQTDQRKEKETNDRKIETAPDSPAVRLERLRQRVQELQTKPPAKP